MNEFSIGNIGKFGARLNDLEAMVGGGATSSPDCQISNVEKMRRGDEIDWSICALGYVINPDGDNPYLVRIYAGEIDRIPVAQTDLTVADGNYVYARRTIANNTMAICAGASVPADDATYRYYKLYEFSVTDKVATIKKIWRPFSIETLPSPPDTKNDYVLMSIAGVVQWVQTEEFACPI